MIACEGCGGRCELRDWQRGRKCCQDCTCGSCVPLCAADRAYGHRAPWWRHEALCPARENRRPRPPE